MKTDDGERRSVHGASRRNFLAATLAAGAMAGAAQSQPATAISFSHSYLYCVPEQSGIWVRMQAECHARFVDTASGREQEYVLGTVAKTGLTPLPDDTGFAPGYDYSVIFSKTHVYTKRSHVSALFNNPTTQAVSEFGETGWKLDRLPARPLTGARDVRTALQGGEQITAVSRFTAKDGEWTWEVAYPVKWADCATDGGSFRVETGPVLLLRQAFKGAGAEPGMVDFEWAHLDYRSFDSARCLVEGPTAILSDMDYAPGLARVAISAEQAASIQSALHALGAPAGLLQTDHYSGARNSNVVHSLFALERPKNTGA